MENFGNVVMGYDTEYYCDLMKKSKDNLLCSNAYSNGMNGHNGQNHNGNYFLVNYSLDRGNRNYLSQISQEGLEIRAVNAEIKKDKINKELNIKILLKIKNKSKRWAKRQHDGRYTTWY